jgi:hypothetical protein
MPARLPLAAAFALLLSGCGGDGKPPAVPAGGKVMYRKTAPPEGALVVFHPADPAAEKRVGGKPFGKVGADGTFRLTTYAAGDGAPEGEYGVTVDWQPKPKKESKFSLGGEGAGGASVLNPKYSNPQKPFATVTVKRGQPNEFAFDVD